MEARKLRTLLRTLQEFGVASYQDGGITVQFGGTGSPPTGDVTGNVGDLALPSGVLNVQAEIDRIKRVYAKGGAS